jgi:hypothetical protein
MSPLTAIYLRHHPSYPAPRSLNILSITTSPFLSPSSNRGLMMVCKKGRMSTPGPCHSQATPREKRSTAKGILCVLCVSRQNERSTRKGKVQLRCKREADASPPHDELANGRTRSWSTTRHLKQDRSNPRPCIPPRLPLLEQPHQGSLLVLP